MNDLAAYQRAFRAHTPAAWEMVESGQADLLNLLVDRLPADLGVGVIFGVSVLFGGRADGDQAGFRLVTTMLDDLAPARSHLLVVTLADAWRSAEYRSIDDRAPTIRAVLRQAIRRLLTTTLSTDERQALESIDMIVTQPEDSIE